MTTLYIEKASQSTQPKDSQKYAGAVPISMFGPPKNISRSFFKKLLHICYLSLVSLLPSSPSHTVALGKLCL
jgi:hypothetical protein